MPVELKPPTYKRKLTIRGLDAVQAVYSFIVALGFRQLFLVIHEHLTKRPPSSGLDSVVPWLLFLNAFLIGLRFFWVSRNLRTTLVVHELSRAKAELTKNLDSSARADPSAFEASGLFIAVNLAVIFVHGGLYFFMCSEVEFFEFNLAVRSHFGAATIDGYVFFHILLLTLNSLWIALLTSRESSLRQKANLPSERDHGGVFWYRNNVICSAIALSLFVLAGSCPHWAGCLEGLGHAPSEPSSPLSPKNFAFLQAALPEGLPSVLPVLVVLLINSLLDLAKTGRHYIFLEEFEREETLDEVPPPPPKGATDG